MKPTEEQLKDPKWWSQYAPEMATHRGDDGRWYQWHGDGWSVWGMVISLISGREEKEAGWKPFLGDVPIPVTVRPDYSVDTTEKSGQKHDNGKPMMSLVPPAALLEVANVLTFGAQKYSPDNWRKVEDLHRRYTDAALRHINAYQRGEQIDDESGLPHLAHAVCCLMFMLEVDTNDNPA